MTPLPETKPGSNGCWSEQIFKLDKSNWALLNKAYLICLEQKISFEEHFKPGIRNLADGMSWDWIVEPGNLCSYDKKCDTVPSQIIFYVWNEGRKACR